MKEELLIIERIRQVIKTERLSVDSFAKITDISRYTLDSMFKKGTKPSFDTLNKIIGAYPQYSADWLLTGKGMMLKASALGGDDQPFLITTTGTKYFEMPDGKYRMRVPLVSVKAYAKYMDEHRDVEYVNDLDEVEFVVDKIGLGKYFAFEIRGDSMDDDSKRSICDKDIVLARQLHRDLWRSKLHSDEYPNWIIVLDNTIVCKQIVSHDVSQCSIVCHSLNPSPEYSDFKLSLNDVRQLFNIVARQSSSF